VKPLHQYSTKIFIAFFFCSLFLLQSCGDTSRQISYTKFRQEVEKGNVALITVSGDEITGQFKKPLESPVQTSGPPVPGSGTGGYPLVNSQSWSSPDFITYLPSFGDPGLFSLLESKGVEVNTRPKPDTGWGSIGNVMFLFLLFGIGFVILRRMKIQRPDVFSSGNLAQLREYTRGPKRVSFSDVAGSEAPKAELQEIVDFLKNPKRFQRLGGRVPKGALLIGPPGTGKTLLARAVAGEAGVPFFSISGSDFMEVYVGVGASRVRSMFKKAKSRAPSILFIDELDSIGAQRGLGYGGGHGEREQTLNQLLSEMDGFEANVNVIVLAATNRPDILDPALLRPGRFDRQINVDLPSLDERLAILQMYSRNKPLAKDIDLKTIARSTPSFSGADLENLLNEAAILASREEKTSIDQEAIQQARDKIIMGLERKNLHIGKDELKVLAYHEGGHALVAALLPNTEPLYKVTIIPRGRAMGMTQQLPEEKYVYIKDYVSARLAVMLGGRAAEMLVFNTSTSGSEQDLKQAITLARKMVLDWGMSEHLPNVAFGGQREMYMEGVLQKPSYSEATATKIDEEVNRLIYDAFDEASRVLKRHRDHLDRVAALLIEKEEIPGSEVLKILTPVNVKSPMSDDRSLTVEH
jgi:cell division protease FtsH